MEALSAGEIEQGLRKGDTLQFMVDAGTVLRPVNRRVMGISFFNLWDYVPIYSRTTGEWILNEHAAKAIESLHVPFSRTYWLDPGRSGRVAWNMKGAIDRVAKMCQRFGIRQEDFVLELERQAYRQSTNPEEWAEAVRYSREKGYRFRLWEVCNEPYGLGGPRDDPWKPQDYVAHVKAVYKAVKAVRPDAQIGMAADLSPWNHFQATQTDNPMLGQLAGYYDFVCPHYYCHMKSLDQVPFERITFEGNAWILSAYVRPMRALLAKYNPGRKIEILDTEWGMHGYANGGGRADFANRNSNIAGTLHRAIRMIFYLNDGLVEGASQWGMLSPANAPGFGIVAINDDRRFLPYYLNYHLSRHVGDEVLPVSGTCPYYEKAGVKFDFKPELYDIRMPKVPVVATKSRREESVSCRSQWHRERELALPDGPEGLSDADGSGQEALPKQYRRSGIGRSGERRDESLAGEDARGRPEHRVPVPAALRILPHAHGPDELVRAGLGQSITYFFASPSRTVQATSSLTTCPWTSVSRNSRPA